MADLRIERGTGSVAEEMAALMVQAFHEKVLHEIRPESDEQAVRIVMAGMCPDRAHVAFADDDSVLGVAGVGTRGRPFMETTLATMRREFGLLPALPRFAYSLLDRFAVPRDPRVVRVEVLAVREDSRGRGIGQALLRAAVDGASADGAKAVTLEVVDTNGRARDLYERTGFRCIRSLRTGLITAGGGYHGVHFMRMDL